MKETIYRTSGTCSGAIRLVVDDDNIIRDMEFFGGCDGNLKAVCKLSIGQKAEDVANLLRGTTCGFKPTSCPDQLAHAIDEMLA